MLGEEVDGAGMEPALARLRSEQPELTGHLAEPMLGVTLSPTMVRASEKANVIPSVAEALIDCRVPPGHGPDEVRERVAALLEGDEYEIEFTETAVGTTSSLDTPLAAAIASWLAEADPGAGLAPTVMAGFSDSNWFRAAFPEATVYGFCPQREIERGRIGAADPLRRRARPGLRRRAGGPVLLRAPFEGAGVSGANSIGGSNGAGADNGAGPQPLRLGGMALRNGLLIHGPTSWAAAARDEDGEIQVASGPEAGDRADAGGAGPPAARSAALGGGLSGGAAGPDRACVPHDCRSRTPKVVLTMIAASGAGRLLRRHGGASRELAQAALGLAPAMVALSDRDLAAYHGVEHKAIGAYEQGSDDPASATKEHERCGSNLVAPMLAFSVAGQLLADRLLERPGPVVRTAVGLAASRSRSSCSPGASATPTPASRAPSTARATRSSASIATKEPTPEQLEVGVAALNEILRVEQEEAAAEPPTPSAT